MGRLYEVVAITGKYTNRDGQEKNRYLNIGAVIETNNGGLMLKMEAVPVGWDGTAFLNTPKEREGQQQPPQQQRRQAPQEPQQRRQPSKAMGYEMDDEIPF